MSMQNETPADRVGHGVAVLENARNAEEWLQSRRQDMTHGQCLRDTPENKRPWFRREGITKVLIETRVEFDNAGSPPARMGGRRLLLPAAANFQ
jgi:hypothetical protein